MSRFLTLWGHEWRHNMSQETGECPWLSLSGAVSHNHFVSAAEVWVWIFLAASRTDTGFTLSPNSFSRCSSRMPCFPGPTTNTPPRMKPSPSRFPEKPPFRARNGGFSGNLEGEGFILGGVFVVGPGKQGILLEHREKEFGDKVNPVSVLEAARKIQTQTSAAETK